MTTEIIINGWFSEFDFRTGNIKTSLWKNCSFLSVRLIFFILSLIIHSYIHSFIHSFIGSLVRSFVAWFIRSFVQSIYAYYLRIRQQFLFLPSCVADFSSRAEDETELVFAADFNHPGQNKIGNIFYLYPHASKFQLL